MDVPCLFEGAADPPDAPVHHVGRRHDVDSGSGLRKRLLHQRVQRHVVEDVAGLVDHAVLAVGGIGIERDIAHDAELRETLLEGAHDARHQPLGIERFAPVQALEPLLDDREQRERRDSQLQALLGNR